MSDVNVAKGYLDSFVVRANDVIWFKLVRSEDDLDLASITKEGSGAFQPDFTHQLFGEQENIFGYRDLKIVILYSSSRLNRFISITYTEKLDSKNPLDVSPDDVLAILNEKIPGPFDTNLDVFSKKLSLESTFGPIGEKLNETVVENFKDGTTKTYEVYRSDSNDNGFLDYHENLQTWLLWFIDGASYIDVDDDRWEFFTIFERVKVTGVDDSSKTNGHTNGSAGFYRFHFAGYCTVYRYYAYPEKVRPRISQFLILPPFQRQGLGRHLLQSIYDFQIGQSKVLDVTVEDPSDNFVKLRDYVDCLNCMKKLTAFQKESVLSGWTEEMAKEAQEKLKLNRKQTRRVYEILKLKYINRSNPIACREYRLEVKSRLNAPFLKMKRKDLSVDQTGLAASAELRMEELKNLYNEVEEEYLETIEKLAAA